jgi:HK97 family phage major capsid protein
MIGQYLQQLKLNKSYGNNEVDDSVLLQKQITDKFLSYLGSYNLGLVDKATKIMVQDGKGNGARVPYDIEQSWTDGLAYIVGEGVAKTESTPQLGYFEQDFCKIVAIIPATDELISDSALLENRIIELGSQAIIRKLEYMMLNNASTDKVAGILNSDQAVYINTALSAITIANYRSMIAALHPSANKSAQWLINKTDYDKLDQVFDGKDTLKYDLYNPTLFAQPINKSPFALSEVQDEGKITAVLADWSRYTLVMKPLKIKISNQVGFKTDETLYRLELRVAGRLIAPVSANNESPVVVGYNTAEEVQSSSSSSSTSDNSGW